MVDLNSIFKYDKGYTFISSIASDCGIRWIEVTEKCDFMTGI
jgi:hypothetical protein